MRTTINVEDQLLKELKRCAVNQNRTLGEVVNETLRVGFLQSREAAPMVEEPPLKTFRGSGVRPGVDLSDSRRLHELMDAE